MVAGGGLGMRGGAVFRMRSISTGRPTASFQPIKALAALCCALFVAGLGLPAAAASVVSRKWLDILSPRFPLFPGSPTWFDPFQPLPRPLHFHHYIFHRCRPHEGSGRFVPRLQELLNDFLQLCDTDKSPAAHSLLCQLAKPPFHLIEPTGTGRNEVKSKSRVAL